MADNSNPSVMIDLDFTRTSWDGKQSSGATVYSDDEREQVVEDMIYQGWALVKETKII